MSKSPKFEVVKRKGKWWVNIPQLLSETGKRQQRSFPTRAKANEFAKTLREEHKTHGSYSRTLRASLADDAAKAITILEPYGVTLKQAAEFYLSCHDKRSKAPTVSEAFDQHIKRGEHLRERTIQNLKQSKKLAPDDFLLMNAYDVSGDIFDRCLKSVAKTPGMYDTHFRIWRSVFRPLKTAGFIDACPTKSVLRGKKPRTKPPVIFTPDQVQALFDSCIDYKDGEARHCADCSAPFALCAFAGVRAEEVTRLKWAEHIKLGETAQESCIHLTANEAKTDMVRSIECNETLFAWLSAVGAEKRTGLVIPKNWKRKSSRVRKEAGLKGINKENQNALRHSYGTYRFSIEKDDHVFRREFGHRSSGTYFKHYHTLSDKTAAKKFFAIKPS